jgi:predicted amidohydrolase
VQISGDGMNSINRTGLTLLKWYLGTRTSNEALSKYIFSKKAVKSHNLKNINHKGIRVAAIQERIELAKSPRKYADKMYALTEEAVNQGAQLVVFPEENGLMCLGAIPLINTIIKSMGSGTKNPKDNGDKKDFSLSEIFYYLTPFIKKVFETTFSRLAEKFGIYIMAGSTILEESGNLYNRAYLFGPDGDLVGTQDKAHLVASEVPLGIKTAEEMKVFDTQIGKLAFPVCMDASYFETFKILRGMGAQIVMIPIANMEQYNKYLALRGIWPRVQENPVYGIKAALVGDLHDVTFTGKAGIFAPIGLTEDRNGVIAEANDFSTQEVICADIDLTLLDNYSDPYFSDTNPEFYKKYFPDVYNNPVSFDEG